MDVAPDEDVGLEEDVAPDVGSEEDVAPNVGPEENVAPHVGSEEDVKPALEAGAWLEGVINEQRGHRPLMLRIGNRGELMRVVILRACGRHVNASKCTSENLGTTL